MSYSEYITIYNMLNILLIYIYIYIYILLLLFFLLLLLSDLGNAKVIVEAVLLIETITPYIY